MADSWIVTGTFVAVYAGMALGRWPGFAVDRTGVALVGAIFLFVVGAMDTEALFAAIDFSVLVILFALMVLSAQVAASGFFERISTAIAVGGTSPGRILALVVVTGGILSAVLTNDVVVWAMTPVLIQGLRARGLDPRPFVIALACAANAGSAATVIGNPQNLLIGQQGGLGFWSFLAVCGVPAVAALAIVQGVVWSAWRRRFSIPASPGTAPPPAADRAAMDGFAGAKAALAALAVVAVFTLPVARAPWALAIAAVLLLSRRLSTRRMLAMVDWHLLLLFTGLFVVTGAMVDAPILAVVLEAADAAGVAVTAPAVLAALSLIGSNTIGNVPLVIMVLATGIGFSDDAYHALALFSTLSGNLLIVGSMANIIAVERAAGQGVRIGFADYARLGVPVTVLSLAAAYGWLAVIS